jgi:hypothetical protein
MELFQALPSSGPCSPQAVLGQALESEAVILHSTHTAVRAMAFLHLVLQISPTLDLARLVARHVMAASKHVAVRRASSEVFLRIARKALAHVDRSGRAAAISDFIKAANAAGACFSEIRGGGIVLCFGRRFRARSALFRPSPSVAESPGPTRLIIITPRTTFTTKPCSPPFSLSYQ